MVKDVMMLFDKTSLRDGRDRQKCEPSVTFCPAIPAMNPNPREFRIKKKYLCAIEVRMVLDASFTPKMFVGT
jgi:hypothetical protein